MAKEKNTTKTEKPKKTAPKKKPAKKPEEPAFKYNAKEIPTDPGCYLYFDEKGTLLYVGKAKNLRKRVSSYFNKNKKSTKTQVLVTKIRKIETRLVHSETEALILENNLIKEFRPRFNILLRDDKNFLYLRLTAEDIPRIQITRRIVRDGSFYAGPKTSAKGFRKTIDFCQKVFKVRTCRLGMSQQENGEIEVTANPERRTIPCMDYHIKRCTAPCDNQITKEDYKAQVETMKRFLRGDTKQVVKDLQETMMKFAAERNFEAAAKMRDLIQSIEHSTERQTVQFLEHTARDFLHFHRIGANAYCVRIAFRHGKFLDQTELTLRAPEVVSDADVLEQFIIQLYQRVDEIPKEIYVPTELENPDSVIEFLHQQSEGLVTPGFYVPQRGEKKSVLGIAEKNAIHYGKTQDLKAMSKAENFSKALPELAKALQLGSPPKRIEGFDISHYGGEHTVASQVVFVDGAPDNSQYRRFKMKTLSEGKIDDYASMYEALTRRFAKAEDKDFQDSFPDLILIDGGKGQLSTVMQAVMDYAADNPLPKGFDPETQIISLAKKEELVYRPGDSDPIELPYDHPGLQLLQRVRDESHRFAISYTRAARSKKAMKSILDEIPGIGPKAKKDLLKAFGSPSGISSATDEELAKVINKKQLESLRQFL